MSFDPAEVATEFVERTAGRREFFGDGFCVLNRSGTRGHRWPTRYAAFACCGDETSNIERVGDGAIARISCETHRRVRWQASYRGMHSRPGLRRAYAVAWLRRWRQVEGADAVAIEIARLARTARGLPPSHVRRRLLMIASMVEAAP